MAQKTGKLVVTNGGKGYAASMFRKPDNYPAYIARSAALYAGAFATDPLVNYLLHTMDATRRAAYLPTYFKTLNTAASLNNAVFSEANDFSHCTVMLPPGCSLHNPITFIKAGLLGFVWNVGLSSLNRMTGELDPMTDASKVKGLHGSKKFYYVFSSATAQEARSQGLCTNVTKEWQATAQKEGVPIWLEATTTSSMNLYLKCGFEVVDDMWLGVGKVNADGMTEAGGKGVIIRSMVWWPKGADGKNMYPVA